MISNLLDHILKSGLSGLLWVGALGGTAFAQANATPAQAPATQLTSEVVTELQRLRQAVERSTLNQYRVTIAIERLRMQQDLMTRLNRDLEGARRSLAEFQTNRAMMAEGSKELEQAISSAVDPSQRKGLEGEQKQVKLQLSRFEQMEQAERTREAEVRARVEIEQARLNELVERLETLEREFEQQAAAASGTPAKPLRR